MNLDHFYLQRREHYQRDELGQDLMPGEHLKLTVTTSGKAGGEILDVFGSLRVRAVEGRRLVIEISDDLNNVVIAALDAASGTDPRALDPHEPAVAFQQGWLAARRRRWAEHLHRALTRVDVWILISTIALVVLACLTLVWS